MSSMAEKLILIDKEQDKENSLLLLIQQFQSPRDQPNPSVDEKLPIQKKNWECSFLSVYHIFFSKTSQTYVRQKQF